MQAASPVLATAAISGNVLERTRFLNWHFIYNSFNLLWPGFLWGIMSSNVVVFYCLLQLCIHSCLGHLHALMAFGLSLLLDYVLLQMRSRSLSFLLKIEVCSGRLRRV